MVRKRIQRYLSGPELFRSGDGYMHFFLLNNLFIPICICFYLLFCLYETFPNKYLYRHTGTSSYGFAGNRKTLYIPSVKCLYKIHKVCQYSNCKSKLHTLKFPFKITCAIMTMM